MFLGATNWASPPNVRVIGLRIGAVEQGGLVVDDGQRHPGWIPTDGDAEEDHLDGRKQEDEQQHPEMNIGSAA